MARIATRLFATRLLAAAIIVPISAIALTPNQAQAQGYHGGYGGYRGGYGGYHGGYGGYRGGYRGYGPGAIVGGALLGLGVGALLAAPYYATPPAYYAPPPAYYAPPPAYYAPPPAYYPQPYYYGR